MATRRRAASTETLTEELQELITDFLRHGDKDTLRTRVLALVPVYQKVRDIGSSLIAPEEASSALKRILFYFRTYPFTVISHQELMVVSGISEFARRIRELRKEDGWLITSGQTAREMADDGEWPFQEIDAAALKNDDYVLLSTECDQLAAARWHKANRIRRSPGGVRDKILAFFQEYVGQPVSNEELRYVAGDKAEWARRVRELRTEFGWPIKTRNSDRTDLPVGTYVLESLEQLPEHDRRIPDAVQIDVLERDHYACRKCGWRHGDPLTGGRFALELHHLHLHSHGGANTVDNLVTLCNVHHKYVHKHEMDSQAVTAWLTQSPIS